MMFNTDVTSVRSAEQAVSGRTAIRPGVPQLPSIPREQARLARYLGRGRSFPLASREATLTIVSSPSSLPDWSDVLHVCGPFGSVSIADGARLMRALGDIDLVNETGTDAARWQWLQSALLGRLVDTPFSCADRLSRGPFPAPDDLVVLRIELRGTQHVIATHAAAGAQVWLDFLQRSAWAPECLSADRFAGIPLTAAVRVAFHSLPAGVARTLAAGDIIVPDTPLFSCAGEGVIRIGALTAQVRFQTPSALTILYTEGHMPQDNQDDGQYEDFDDSVYDEGSEEYRDGEYEDGEYEDDEFEDEDAAGADYDEEEFDEEGDDGGAAEEFDGDAEVAVGAAVPGNGRAAVPKQAAPAPIASRARRPVDLDKTPVTLGFELGRVRLTLGDLRTLDIGAVLDLTGGSPQAVAIVSSGRRLGSGELVDVDGQLGIRVVEWDAAS